MGNCKFCQRPVERAIEGEIVCGGCWSLRQMTDEDLAAELERRKYEREMRELSKARGKCEGCGKAVRGEEAVNRMCWDCSMEAPDFDEGENFDAYLVRTMPGRIFYEA